MKILNIALFILLVSGLKAQELDSTLTDVEKAFRDSIAALNLENDILRNPRNFTTKELRVIKPEIIQMQ